jgi:hypothetical protein
MEHWINLLDNRTSLLDGGASLLDAIAMLDSRASLLDAASAHLRRNVILQRLEQCIRVR